MSFDAWKDGRVAPATIEVPVVLLDGKESPQLRATLRGHATPAIAMAFAPDGKTLASVTRRGVVKLWDALSGKEWHTLTQPSMAGGLAFLPDGRTLVVPWFQPLDKDGKTLQMPYPIAKVKSYRGGIKLWDATTGKERGDLQPSSSHGVMDLELSPDGKMLAAWEVWHENDGKDFKGTIALWDVTAGKVVRKLDKSEHGPMVFAPDGKTLAFATRKGVQLFDVATGQERGKLGDGKEFMPVLAFAPDGKTLAVLDSQGTVRLWDVARGIEKARLRHGDSQISYCLAFAPDGKSLAIGVGPRNVRAVEPGEIVLWNPSTKEKRLTLRSHVGNIFTLAFNREGSLLASSGVDSTVKLWDIAPRAASKR